MNKNSSASDRANSATELITSGHIGKAVWFLAWPTAIQTLIQTAYMVINLAFVGRLHNAAQSIAAVGAGGAALMIQFGAVIALAVGTSALVSRSLGAGKTGDATEATRQSLILSVVGGIIVGVPYIIWARPIVRGVGAAPAIVPIAADYLGLIAWSSVPMFWWFIISTVLRSAGDTRTPLYMGAASLGLNVVLDRILIWGLGPIPSYGVHGAAVATSIARVFAAAISFIPTFRYSWFTTSPR